MESIVIFTLISIIGVVSIFPITGLTGLFSFGQAAYMAVGAYISGILAVKLNLPFLICAVSGIIIAGILSFIIGYPTLKLRKDYFSLMSLFFGEAITSVLNQFSKYTGGAAGLSSIPKKVDVFVVVVCAVIVVGLVACFKNSRYGRMCLAIKNDELAAKSFGIRVFSLKMKVYIFSSMIAAFAGVLFAFYLQYLDPNLFGWTRSSEWVIFLFFGGTNSLTGSVLSTIFLNIMPEALRFASELRIVMYTLTIILILNFRPEGLLGDKELSLKWLKFGKKNISAS